MKLFLDTSSLFKLYYKERDSDIAEATFVNSSITAIFLSEFTKIEFSSIVWRKVRMQEITALQGKTVNDSFEDDFIKYNFIRIDNFVIEQSRKMLMRYGSQGLRTLDSIQLATAVLLKGYADLFITADKLLNSFFVQETLPNKIGDTES